MRGELLELDLKWCGIGDDGAEIVADFLKHDETVQSVHLRACNFGPRGAEAIAGSLKHTQTVELLNLYYNQIGDEGAEALLDALNYNVCLKWLLVGINNIAPELEATIRYLAETQQDSHSRRRPPCITILDCRPSHHR